MEIYTNKQVKEMAEMISNIKAALITLKGKYIELYFENVKLRTENANLRAIINAPDIDFPNSEKGGKGVPETPAIFPDDSNLF